MTMVVIGTTYKHFMRPSTHMVIQDNHPHNRPHDTFISIFCKGLGTCMVVWDDHTPNQMTSFLFPTGLGTCMVIQDDHTQNQTPDKFFFPLQEQVHTWLSQTTTLKIRPHDNFFFFFNGVGICMVLLDNQNPPTQLGSCLQDANPAPGQASPASPRPTQPVKF